MSNKSIRHRMLGFAVLRQCLFLGVLSIPGWAGAWQATSTPIQSEFHLTARPWSPLAKGSSRWLRPEGLRVKWSWHRSYCFVCQCSEALCFQAVSGVWDRDLRSFPRYRVGIGSSTIFP